MGELSSAATIGFCTMAFGQRRYKEMAQTLAADLTGWLPTSRLIVTTDEPKFFAEQPAIVPILRHPEGILHCYHDRRFALAAALERFPVAIAIDADTRVPAPPPPVPAWQPGLTCISENLFAHSQKYTPGRLPVLRRLANKLNLDIEQTQWIGESFLVLVRGSDREAAFLSAWGRIGRYLELHGIHAGSGNAIGLAAAVSGLPIHNNPSVSPWLAALKHLDASHRSPTPSRLQKVKRSLKFHWRLNRARLAAVKEFDFYYR